MDNSGSNAAAQQKEPSDEGASGAENDPQAQARRWIEIEGRHIAIKRMPNDDPGKVDMLLARWLDQDLDGDAVGLMTVLIELNQLTMIGAAFHVEVTTRCARYRRQRDARDNPQKTLPLSGVQGIVKRA